MKKMTPWTTAACLATLLLATDPLEADTPPRYPTSVVTFDDLPRDTRVVSQYRGVTFPDGGVVRSAADTGLASWSLPNYLQKDCSGTEFDAAPLRIQFAEDQGWVRVYVGNPEAFPQRAVMRAFDAFGRLLASAEANLTRQAPVSTPLAICRIRQRDIRRVEVTLGTASCEVIDHLAFDPGPLTGEVSTIRFDDRADGTRITTQYPGLNFMDSPWIRTASALGLATQSAPNLLEQYSYGREFDLSPLRVQLMSPSSYVRVFVGNRRPSAKRVTLRAYSATTGGSLVGSLFHDFTTASGVMEPLEVCCFGDQSIRRIEVEDSDSDFELIDNLEFVTSASPPVPDTAPPTAFFDNPRTGDLFYRDAISVRGRIREDRGLERATLTVQEVDGARRVVVYDLLGAGLTGSAPDFAFGLSLSLFPGRNTLRIDASDTSGNLAVNAERQVTLTLEPPIHILIDSPTPDFISTSASASVTGRIQITGSSLTADQVRVRVSGAGHSSPWTPVRLVTGAPPEQHFALGVSLFSAAPNSTNLIEAEAVTSDGQRASASVAIFYSRPDVFVSALEITQATEKEAGLTLTEGSFLPLAAQKKTVVRVYGNAARWLGTAPINVRQVSLRGRRGGLELAGSPLVLTQTRLIRPVWPAVLYREKVDATWNFELPDEWTRAGELELTATMNRDGFVLECGGCTPNNDYVRGRILFQARRPLVVVPVLASVNGSPMADPTLVEPAFEGARRMFPTPSVQLGPRQILTITDPDLGRLGTDAQMNEFAERIADLYTCFDGEWYGWFLDRIAGCSWDRYYLGLVAPGVGGRGGMADGAPAPAAWARIDWVLGGVAHELGHTLGLQHAPGAGAADPDPRFPDPRGGITDTGFDTTAMKAIPFGRGSGWPDGVPTLTYFGGPMTPNAIATDFMSYFGDPAWISPYHWSKLFGEDSHGSRLEAGPGEKPTATSSRAAAASTRWVGVQGYVQGDGSVRIRRAAAGMLPGDIQIAPKDGRYRLDVLDVNGKAIASSTFEPEPGTESDPREPFSKFRIVTPLPADAARLAIIGPAGKTLAERRISAKPPEVRMSYPNGGEHWLATAIQRVMWVASDADGDALTYAIQYSPDKGKTWIMAASEIKQNYYDLDTSWLPGGDASLMRVIANDGVLTAKDESDGVFLVARKGPSIAIVSPKDGVTVPGGSLLRFEADGSDEIGERIPDKSLQWESSRDGVLGFGSRLEVSKLSPGSHTIRLTGRDAAGLAASAQIRLEVVPAPAQ